MSDDETRRSETAATAAEMMLARLQAIEELLRTILDEFRRNIGRMDRLGH